MVSEILKKKKRFDLMYHRSVKSIFFFSFFWRSQDNKFCFRDYLTFTKFYCSSQQNCLPLSCLAHSVLVIRVHKGQNMTYLTRNQSYDWSSRWKLSTPIRSVSYGQRPPGWRANPSAASGTSAREVNSHDEYSLFALYPRAPKENIEINQLTT